MMCIAYVHQHCKCSIMFTSDRMHLRQPTQIQSLAIPQIMKGRDVYVLSLHAGRSYTQQRRACCLATDKQTNQKSNWLGQDVGVPYSPVAATTKRIHANHQSRWSQRYQLGCPMLHPYVCLAALQYGCLILAAVVLAPTRELCLQIFNVLQQLLGAFHWIVASSVMGGEKKKSEKARLRKGE